MMDLTQQPFTLGGSQRSCHGVYKHGLLRSVSSWDSVSGCLSVRACVCDSNVEYLKLKAGGGGTQENPTRQTQTEINLFINIQSTFILRTILLHPTVFTSSLTILFL